MMPVLHEKTISQLCQIRVLLLFDNVHVIMLSLPLGKTGVGEQFTLEQIIWIHHTISVSEATLGDMHTCNEIFFPTLIGVTCEWMFVTFL